MSERVRDKRERREESGRGKVIERERAVESKIERRRGRRNGGKRGGGGKEGGGGLGGTQRGKGVKCTPTGGHREEMDGRAYWAAWYVSAAAGSTTGLRSGAPA